MSLKRRQFSLWGAAALAGFGTLGLPRPGRSMDQPGLKILILGGTGFLGPHLVGAALERGHTLTLFNRGKTDPQLFPDLERLKGNRAGKLEPLMNRSWDVVIDTSSFVPQQVAKSAALLAPNVGHYVFVSSTAVYKRLVEPGMDESAPVYDPSLPEAKEYTTFENYGALKFASEQQVSRFFPNSGTNVRSEAIVGPGDRRHLRYPYWVRRAGQGGEILGPGKQDDFIQYIDVRDLADWLVHCAEKSVFGTFNATSEPASYSMGNMIADCLTAADRESPVTWVDSEFLVGEGLVDMPLWLPDRAPGFGQLSNAKAAAAGLKQRSKLQTARDVRDWLAGLPAELQGFKVGPTLEEEAALLAAWKQAQP